MWMRLFYLNATKLYVCTLNVLAKPLTQSGTTKVVLWFFSA